MMLFIMYRTWSHQDIFLSRRYFPVWQFIVLSVEWKFVNLDEILLSLQLIFHYHRSKKSWRWSFLYHTLLTPWDFLFSVIIVFAILPHRRISNKNLPALMTSRYRENYYSIAIRRKIVNKINRFNRVRLRRDIDFDFQKLSSYCESRSFIDRVIPIE